MRLLKVASFISDRQLELEEFVGNDRPRYAILSHTWMRGEILYSDILQENIHKPALTKIEYTLQQAYEDDLEYVWIDTCCIDKNSSAELQEAINSMFLWYQKAACCYVYLQDVTLKLDDAGFAEQFSSSRWFTRGWTLQELLAPKNKGFFTNTWAFIGAIKDTHRRQVSGLLIDLICEATGIQKSYVAGVADIFSTSIATRMSWASRRSTSRSEDLVYCLLGIFKVSMPLLYGEGAQQAFYRLQQEIMRQTDDTSLFLWTSRRQPDGRTVPQFHGLLAGDAQQCRWTPDAEEFPFSERTRTVPYIMTNKGLRIELLLKALADDIYLGVMGYVPFMRAGPRSERSAFFAIYLKRMSPDANFFMRVFSDKTVTLVALDPHLLTQEEVFIPQNMAITRSTIMDKRRASSVKGSKDVVQQAVASCLRFRDAVSGFCIDATATTRRMFGVVMIWVRTADMLDWNVVEIDAESSNRKRWELLLYTVFELIIDDQRPCIAILLENLASEERIEIQLMQQMEAITVKATHRASRWRSTGRVAHRLHVERADMVVEVKEEKILRNRTSYLKRWSPQKKKKQEILRQYYVLRLHIEPLETSAETRIRRDHSRPVLLDPETLHSGPLDWNSAVLSLYLPLTPGSAQSLSTTVRGWEGWEDDDETEDEYY